MSLGTSESLKVRSGGDRLLRFLVETRELTLLALILAIANINVWNRLNVATRQPAGEWKP